MDLLLRLRDLSHDVGVLDPSEKAPEQVVVVFNALLAAVKEQVRDPLVDGLEPVDLGGGEADVPTCGSIMVTTRQLLRAVDEHEKTRSIG